MLLPQKCRGWSPAPPSEIYDLEHQENVTHVLTTAAWRLAPAATGRTFLLEADLDGDKVLKEDVVDVRVVEVKELFQLRGLGIFCKREEENQSCQSILTTVNCRDIPK